MTTAIAMVDAPLVVATRPGMRQCEREVGRRYGRWKVSANSSNLALPALAGVALLRQLAAAGWRVRRRPQRSAGSAAVTLYEVVPVHDARRRGGARLRRSSGRSTSAGRASSTGDVGRSQRAATCDDLIRRLDALRHADPPIDLRSHPVTAALLDEPTPLRPRRGEAPRGPPRRRAVRVDRPAVAAPRPGALPGARQRRRPTARRIGGDDPRPGPPVPTRSGFCP